jgi:hypothetical protein
MFQERRREGGRGDEAWRRGKKEALTEEESGWEIQEVPGWVMRWAGG